MNLKQIISMWVGIGLILFIAVVTVLGSYSPDYPLFLFWTFLVFLITVAFINTFRTKITERNGSRGMNIRKGLKRLVFVVSLVPVLIGITMLIPGIVDEDEDLLFGGLLTAIIGSGAIWAIYGAVLYIINGFYTYCCDNCEREIGKLDEKYKFNEHTVCAECHKKLNGYKDERIS